MIPWQLFGYRSASFRGVPFFVAEHDQTAGRRVVRHEFPLRETNYTEDMGRQIEMFRVDAYVLGDTYLLAADALYRACARSSAVGTLVHPYLGQMQVRCAGFRRKEVDKEGRIARMDLLFVEAGTQPSPTSQADTAATVLAAVGNVLAVAARVYGLVVAVAANPALLGGILAAGLADLAGNWISLPLGTIAGLAGMLGNLAGTASFPADTAVAIVAAAGAYADTVTASTWSAPDRSAGLAALAGYGAPVPTLGPATPLRAILAANTNAVVDLGRGAAIAAMAQLYASLDWPTAQAATAARAQLADLIDARALAAADAGQADLFNAWQSLGAAVLKDLTVRAQKLPTLSAYRTPSGLPALALAQRLHQDARRANELVALNGAHHPGFMPDAGYMLVA